MAGSYKHVTTGKGKLRSPDSILLDDGGDYYEAIEEMYGMIWYLADQIGQETNAAAADIVEQARQAYQEGIAASPGIQGRPRK